MVSYGYVYFIHAFDFLFSFLYLQSFLFYLLTTTHMNIFIIFHPVSKSPSDIDDSLKPLIRNLIAEARTKKDHQSHCFIVFSDVFIYIILY